MSTIPNTREGLIDLITADFGALVAEIGDHLPLLQAVNCVDDWTVKDLLAVRLWWSEQVVSWLMASKSGQSVTLPAPGYRWSQTKVLNAAVIADAKALPGQVVWQRLQAQPPQILKLIESLSDRVLLQAGVVAWAGKYPVARWCSLNTATQYRSARRYVRDAKRACGVPLWRASRHSAADFSPP